MVSIILFVTACVVLVAAAVLLAKSHKKESKIQPPKEQKEQAFNTKYDELVYLYKSGAIKEEEYKNKYLFRERSEIREQIMFPEF